MSTYLALPSTNELRRVLTDSDVVSELGNLTLAQLQELTTSLAQMIEDLTTENVTFDKHFIRVNAYQMEEAKNTVMDNDNAAANEAEDVADNPKMTGKFAANARKKKIEKKTGSDGPMLLTIDQRVDIMNRETEEMRNTLAEQLENWTKVADNYKAELECVDVTLTELKKNVAEFRRDIVVNALDMRTGKITAEKLTRYYEEKIRAKDALIEKIRLKNSTLRQQKHKMQQQLKQKEEMGEVLHAIDYDQLQIENSQYLVKIEEKNIELSNLKFKTGNILQRLNTFKKKLDAVLKETETYSREIVQRRELIQKLIQEGERVSQERRRELQNYSNLKQQIEDFKIPEVMEYVQLQAEQRDLKQRINILTRKIDIHRKDLARSKMILGKLQKNEKSREMAKSPRSPAKKLVLPLISR